MENSLLNAEYIKLLIGQLVAHFADAVIQLVLIAWVASHFSVSGKLIAAVFFCFLLPQFLLSPFIGDFSDRFNRKSVLVLSNLYRFLLIVGILVFVKCVPFDTDVSFGVIIIFAFLLGTGYSFFYSAKIPAITNVVSSDYIKSANAINSGLINFINIFGAAIAGGLIIFTGINKALLLAAMSYLFAALIFSFISFIFPQKIEAVKRNIINEVRSVLKYFSTHRVISDFLFLSVAISFILGVFVNALNTLVIDYYHLGVAGITVVRVMHGIGILLGMLMAFYLVKSFKISSLCVLGFLLLFLPLVTFSLCKTITLISVWLLPIGAASVLIYVIIDSGLQKASPDKIRGKVFGVQLSFNTLAFLVGTFFIMNPVTTPVNIIKVVGAFAGIVLVLILLNTMFRGNYRRADG